MTKIYKTTFRLRRGNAEEWEQVNPVLQSGEPGFEVDALKLKIGNGVDNYKNLPYITGSGIEVSGATVGQTIRIAAVNESGTPTVWEAADFPESTNDSDALETLAECGVITPAYQDGVFYTDASGAIYVL